MLFCFHPRLARLPIRLLDHPARLERKRLLCKPLGLQFALVPFAFFPTCTRNERKKYEKIKSCYESLRTWLVFHWATGICSISQLDSIVPCGLAMVACCKLFPRVKVIRVCSHSLRLNDNSHRIILRGWCLKRTRIIPISPFTLTLHPHPSTLHPHPSPSPFTLTLHPSPSPSPFILTLHPSPSPFTRDPRFSNAALNWVNLYGAARLRNNFCQEKNYITLKNSPFTC